MIRDAIGHRLRELREGAGLTQAELARRMEMAQTAISKIEGGERLPPLDTIESWAQACGRELRIEFPPAADLQAEQQLFRLHRRLFSLGVSVVGLMEMLDDEFREELSAEDERVYEFIEGASEWKRFAVDAVELSSEIAQLRAANSTLKTTYPDATRVDQTDRAEALLRRVVECDAIRSEALAYIASGGDHPDALQTARDMLIEPRMEHLAACDELSSVCLGLAPVKQRHAPVRDLAPLVEAVRMRPRVPSGFIDLDRVLGGGLRAGALYVVAGAPQVGKTAFALNLASHAAASGLSMYLTTEGDREALNQRLSQIAEALPQAEGVVILDPPAIPSGLLTPLANYLSEIAEKADGRLGLVVIDRVNHLRLTLQKRHRTTPKEYRELGEQLRQVADTLKVPVVAVVGMARTSERRADKRPLIGELGPLEPLTEFAEAVLLLYRDEAYHPDSPRLGVAEVNIAANRAGPTGVVELAWMAGQQRFQNLAKPEGSSGYF